MTLWRGFQNCLHSVKVFYVAEQKWTHKNPEKVRENQIAVDVVERRFRWPVEVLQPLKNKYLWAYYKVKRCCADGFQALEAKNKPVEDRKLAIRR